MVDTPATSETVFRLIHHSHMRLASDVREAELGVFTIARPNNKRRHERVAIISEDPAAERVFGRWSMARVGDGDEPDIPLLMNRDEGGISPAAPRPTTPDQEAVLGDMREAARSGARPA